MRPGAIITEIGADAAVDQSHIRSGTQATWGKSTQNTPKGTGSALAVAGVASVVVLGAVAVGVWLLVRGTPESEATAGPAPSAIEALAASAEVASMSEAPQSETLMTEPPPSEKANAEPAASAAAAAAEAPPEAAPKPAPAARPAPVARPAPARVAPAPVARPRPAPRPAAVRPVRRTGPGDLYGDRK
jgi:hypothetical protein